MFRIPETTLGIVIEVVVSLLASFVVLSFFELMIHKHLMHLKKLPKWFYKLVPHMNVVYSDHAVEHHGRFYKEFDYEPDPVGRHVNLLIRLQDSAFMGIALIPMLLALIVFSPIAFLCWCALGLLHNRVWGLVHVEMHIPNEKNFWKTWGLYRFLARHHFMHHVKPLSNFNVVFPFADFILGTTSKPRLRDVREMYRLGYLLPRSEKAAARREAWQQRVWDRRRATDGAEAEALAPAPVAA